MFDKVYGYNDVKQELELIRSWYLNKKFVKDDRLKFPKGILFYGPVGCGKSLFMYEYSHSFGWPIIELKGTDGHGTIEHIQKVFAKAKKLKKAIIIIDEIDLLLQSENSYEVRRCLQQELDGFNKSSKLQLLVLATTNYYDDIPRALLRAGRFDRKIEIDRPDDNQRLVMYKKFMTSLGIKYETLDWREIIRLTKGVSGVDIQSICNDLYMRVGTSIDTDDVIRSWERIMNEEYVQKRYKRIYEAAVHEAGHILMAIKHKECAFFHDATFNKEGASTFICRKYDYDNLVTTDAHIAISLGGMAGEIVAFGSHGLGATADLGSVKDEIFESISSAGYKGLKYVSDSRFRRNNYKSISEDMLSKQERKVYKILSNYLKTDVRFLKRHKKDLLKIAEAFYERGKLTYKDLPTLNLSHSIISKNWDPEKEYDKTFDEDTRNRYSQFKDESGIVPEERCIADDD